MNKINILILLSILTFSCASLKNNNKLNYGSPNVKQTILPNNTFKIDKYTSDKTYGYTKENPIMVGGVSPTNERIFLNSLIGKNGENISYKRLGSCCPFKTNHGFINNSGMLDKYEITFLKSNKKVILYINMYDSNTLMVPVGFKLKHQ